MENETLSQKALRLLSAIPSEDFICDEYTDNHGKCCAIGHFQRLTSKDPSDYSQTNCEDFGNREFRDLTGKYIGEKHDTSADISCVNNNDHINGYNEPVIKDRVIHLLTDMVAEGL